jgi:ribosome-associated protein
LQLLDYTGSIFLVEYPTVERLRELVIKSLVRPKTRRPTKPTKGSQRRRIEEKKRRGNIKRGRKDDGD